MTFVAHFHGGPRDGTSSEIHENSPPLDLHLDPDEEADVAADATPIPPGGEYPTLPNDRYVLRHGDISDGLHYDWTPDPQR
jgi:hypothetical protein